jgi:hypothetical protein
VHEVQGSNPALMHILSKYLHMVDPAWNLPYDRAWEKAPPYDRAWKKTSHILGIWAYIPSIELNILSIELNTDIYQEYDSIYQVQASISEFKPFSGWKLNSNDPTHVLLLFSKRKDSGFRYGCADAAAAVGRRGSDVYEVNLWLWSFARGKPRLGGLSVEKTFERQVAANEAIWERAAENRPRRKADKA